MLQDKIRSLGAYALLVGEVFKDITTRGVNRGELCRQVIKIGRDSLPVVLLTATFTGMVLALQTAYGLQRFGAKNYVGNIVGLSLVRELGPVLTALMLCGRVGAGISAEIGSMVVTEQVDAIRALGANPISKLVTPRIAAAMLAVPALVVFCTLIGIFGGQLVAVYELNQSAFTYQRALYYTIMVRDLIDALIKSAVFGFLVVSIACYHGLVTKGGTAGVGRSTTAAVVSGSIAVFISDFFVTKVLILLS
ncbi:MAG: ABC transporter permease [Deltaproteobacteria bacterium]|nr:ABC transporter permease [Deltaproteobacteria bacterium]